LASAKAIGRVIMKAGYRLTAFKPTKPRVILNAAADAQRADGDALI